MAKAKTTEAASSGHYRAREAFAVEINGTLYIVTAGQVVSKGDARMTGREAMFEEVTSEPLVEQATKAPGEKRNK